MTDLLPDDRAPLELLVDALGMVWFLASYCDDSPIGKHSKSQAEEFVKRHLKTAEDMRWSHKVVPNDPTPALPDPAGAMERAKEFASMVLEKADPHSPWGIKAKELLASLTPAGKDVTK